MTSPSKPDRPWCCPDPKCTPLHQLAGSSYPLSQPRPGESFSCFGQMAEGIEFSYDGAEHANDLRSCHYTPLKGLIAWQENVEDWKLLVGAYTEAIKLAEEVR